MPQECEKEIFEVLRTLNFAYPSDPTKHPPRVRYERLQKQIEQNEKDSETARAEIVKLAGCYDDISFVIDYFTIKKEKYAALERIAMTNRIFVLTGYIPEKRAAKVIDALERNTRSLSKLPTRTQMPMCRCCSKTTPLSRPSSR